jgi:glycosyltransferase involved in cell wall biosynthesis
LPTLLSVNNYYYRRGGADIIFLEENRLFKDLGWYLVPFSMHHSRNLGTPWSKYFVSEIELGQPYSFCEKMAKVSKAIFSFEARKKISHVIDIARPDVAHCHNIYHHISPSILSVLKQHGIPTILTLHDLKLACPAYSMLTHDGICERCKNRRLYNVMTHRCIKGSLSLSGIVMLESALHRLLGSYEKNVDRFVVSSRFYQQKMIEWGCNAHRFVHIPNGIHVAAYKPDFRPGKSFLYFGRLSPEKGLITLINAAAKAKVSLWIAGTGPLDGALHRIAEEQGAEVIFLGYLTGEALHNAVRSARATVLPSEWYENAPMSILETYAMGKPVIGAAIGGIPELVRESETGITFKSGSVESLADALERFKEMPDTHLAEMGRCGRAWVESDYTAERYCDRLLELYGDIGVSFQ